MTGDPESVVRCGQCGVVKRSHDLSDHPWVPYETVDHPAHYNNSPARCKHGHQIECIDVVQWMTFNQGNAVKYLWRMFDKGDPAENLRKAIEYCQFEIGRLQDGLG